MSQVSTHILDTALGQPAAGITVTLYQRQSGEWHELGRAHSNADGRVQDLCDADQSLPAGTYRIHFAVAEYFTALHNPVFYPWAEVAFNIEDEQQHYHIPLLLSPFGYSTYRGS